MYPERLKNWTLTSADRFVKAVDLTRLPSELSSQRTPSSNGKESVGAPLITDDRKILGGVLKEREFPPRESRLA